jgi:hypothetical protein
MFDRRRKRWGALDPRQQRLIIAGAVAQLALQAAMLWDVHRRTSDELRGSRRWWTAAAFVNVVGPVVYFTLGRRGPHRAV